MILNTGRCKLRINKREKVKIGVIVILLIAITAGTVFLFQNQKEQASSDSAEATPGASGPSITVTSYQAYKLDSLDFTYVIASIHVETEGELNISLDHFTTDEGISLDDTADYRKKMSENSLSLDGQNVVDSLKSNQSLLDANVFIPIKKKDASSVTVSCDIEGVSKMVFDLSSASSDATGFAATAQASSTADMQAETNSTVEASASFEITGESLLQKGSEMMLPSTARVFAFKVTVNGSADSPITLSSAEYDAGSAGVFAAEDSSVYSENYPVIIGKKVTDRQTGYVFVILLDQDRSISSYSGTLKLYLEGSNNPVEINAVLQ
jgi:uncharacterized protein YpmB